MKISIIPADNTIVVDGVGRLVTMPDAAVAGAPAADIHAVQWDGAVGHVERRSGTTGEPKVIFTDAAPLAPYLGAWEDAA